MRYRYCDENEEVLFESDDEHAARARARTEAVTVAASWAKEGFVPTPGGCSLAFRADVGVYGYEASDAFIELVGQELELLTQGLQR